MIVIVLLLISACPAYSFPHITIFGDVFLNKEFFTNTLPWIVDNIGGDLSIQFYMLGSGRHTIPQMCALEQLVHNAFLQAQYLKCEAEGHPNSYCLCEAGIDSENFKHCVRGGGSLASQANAQYARLKLDALPLVEVGYKDTVFEVADSWYLKKICTLYLEDLPLGCVKPFSCNSTEIWNSRPGIAQMDRECKMLDCSESGTTTQWYPN
ncbi:uncharacterized protein LOC106143258 [Amyelois transitella]|uniref:uncharacterized protein LOC106143258 n=1 Tax=Amyelois transitella TaxID=680683 RepID=UPI00067C9CA3|nr:uncharacterized protein LOC106143258 [Amyelois transitella]